MKLFSNRARAIIRLGEDLVWPIVSAAVVLVIWHFSVIWSGTKVFPSPLAVWIGVGELVSRGVLWVYIGDSLFRVGAGYFVAVFSGIPFGLALGWYPNLARSFNALIQMLRPISPLAWIPLAIIFFGVSNMAPIFLVFLGAFFPVVVSTMNGVASVPAMYLRAGSNFGLTPAQILARVVFPAALPQVLTGLRISLGIGWIVVVAAEMIAVDSGLGYLIIDSRNAGKRYDLVVAGMLLIGLIGLGLDVMMRRTEKLRAVRWGFRREAA